MKKGKARVGELKKIHGDGVGKEWKGDGREIIPFRLFLNVRLQECISHEV